MSMDKSWLCVYIYGNVQILNCVSIYGNEQKSWLCGFTHDNGHILALCFYIWQWTNLELCFYIWQGSELYMVMDKSWLCVSIYGN